MGMMGGYGPGFGGYGLMGGYIGLIFNIAIMIGIVFLVVWAVRQFTRGNTGASYGGNIAAAPRQTAKEILAERYARGEISRDEYQTMLKDIS